MVSTCLISKSSCLFIHPLVIVSSAPLTIDITGTSMFHTFFHFPIKFKVLIFSLPFSFTLWLAGTTKSIFGRVFFFLLIIIRSGRLAEFKWSVCITKSQRILFVSFSRTNSVLFVWLNSSFLHNSPWITFPTQPCLFIDHFSASLLHSPIMWLIVSSLSLDNPHLLFTCTVMVIVVGNGHGDTSSSPVRGWLHFIYH